MEEHIYLVHNVAILYAAKDKDESTWTKMQHNTYLLRISAQTTNEAVHIYELLFSKMDVREEQDWGIYGKDNLSLP